MACATRTEGGGWDIICTTIKLYSLPLPEQSTSPIHFADLYLLNSSNPCEHCHPDELHPFPYLYERKSSYLGTWKESLSLPYGSMYIQVIVSPTIHTYQRVSVDMLR